MFDSIKLSWMYQVKADFVVEEVLEADPVEVIEADPVEAIGVVLALELCDVVVVRGESSFTLDIYR